MNKLIYKTWTFEDDQVKSGSCYMETSLPSSSLGINTLETVVKCADGAIADFAQNDPVTYFYKGAQRGIYYLQSVERIGPERYTLTAVSTLGLLAQKGHPGGIYTGQTVQEVVTDICGDIPVIIKSNLANIALYGWLPYVAPPKTSAKDNLSQVLFAIGAAVTNDLNGVLRIEPLWSGVSGVLDDDHVCQGGKVTTEPVVTAVSVTEHQYFQGGETKELFNGSTQSGDIITFDEPAYDLTADGFSILESGANYAKVSAGSGTLTGRSYIHNTRQVTVEVTPGPVENIKTPTGNPTLVSLVNAYAVAQRLAAYYKCRDTIKVSALIGGNRPGAVVSMYHPYDKKMVKACLAVTDAHMSAVIKADLEALVGFEPPDIAQQEYYDFREVLTGSGEWSAPDGVDNLTAVLIGGAQGGGPGNAGESATWPTVSSESQSGSVMSMTKGFVMSNLQPHNGGDPGHPGNGGKVLVANIQVIANTKIAYSCGIGGRGAVFGTESIGAFGSPTTFGELSSEDGSTSDNGYSDIMTGEIFAALGDEGVAGGKGCGYENGELFISPDIVVGDTHFKSGTHGNGAEQSGGAYNNKYAGYFEAVAAGGLGGGPAYGGNGENGLDADAKINYGHSTSSDSFYAYQAVAWPGPGGRGANAIAPQKETIFGKGGKGGNGGGGAGQFGFPSYAKRRYTSNATESVPNSPVIVAKKGNLQSGGDGSDGGYGADGCIILYYRIPKQVKSGAVMDKQGRFAIDRTGRLMVV